jgi:general secretion pathway protein D
MRVFMAVFVAGLLVATDITAEGAQPLNAQPEAPAAGAPPTAPATPLPTPPATAPVVAPVVAQPAAADETEVNNQKTRDKLATRMRAEYLQVPLAEVIAHLSEQLQLDFYIDQHGLEDAGVTTDQPVTVVLREVRGDMLLDLVLGQLGGRDLDYLVRDGIVMITSVKSMADASDVKAYPVADLLKLNRKGVEAGEGLPAAPDPFTPVPGGALPSPNRGPGRFAPGGNPGLVVIDAGTTPPAAIALIQVLERTVAPETWEALGGSGSISYYDEMLVIRQSARVHREVAEVLALLRSTAAQKAAKN